MNASTPGSERLSTTNCSINGCAWSTKVGMMSRWVMAMTRSDRPSWRSSATAGMAIRHPTSASASTRRCFTMNDPPSQGCDRTGWVSTVSPDEIAGPLIQRRRQQGLEHLQEHLSPGGVREVLERLRAGPELEEREAIGRLDRVEHRQSHKPES